MLDCAFERRENSRLSCQIEVTEALELFEERFGALDEGLIGSLDEEGGVRVDHVVEGDEVKDVLAYVQYDQRALKERVRQLSEEAMRRGEVDAGLVVR